MHSTRFSVGINRVGAVAGAADIAPAQVWSGPSAERVKRFGEGGQ